MSKKEFKYKPLSKSKFDKLWKKHKLTIENFIANNGYDTNKISINKTAVMSVITKVHQRGKYYKYFHGLNMSECKETALISFWYIKLRPVCAVSKEISESEDEELRYINEKLALYHILVSLQAMMEEADLPTEKLNSLDTKYIKELIYSFRYRDLSKEALILLVESMAYFLGIDPYPSKGDN